MDQIVSDNTVSSSNSDRIDIDKVIDDLSKVNDDFSDEIVAMLCLRQKCFSLIDNLTQLKTNNVEPDDHIIEEVKIITHAVRQCHMNDQLKGIMDLINKLLYEEEWDIDEME